MFYGSEIGNVWPLFTRDSSMLLLQEEIYKESLKKLDLSFGRLFSTVSVRFSYQICSTLTIGLGLISRSNLTVEHKFKKKNLLHQFTDINWPTISHDSSLVQKLALLVHSGRHYWCNFRCWSFCHTLAAGHLRPVSRDPCTLFLPLNETGRSPTILCFFFKKKTILAQDFYTF